MIIETNLTPHVKSFCFASNHFGVSITDDEENKQNYIAASMVKCSCSHCKKTFLVESVLGAMVCPHCISDDVSVLWVKPQINFIAENEIDMKIKCLEKK